MAEKVAAQNANAATDNKCAISTSTPYELIEHLPGMDLPLRRPSRCQPSKEIEQMCVDAEAARNALQDQESMMPYEEFRREIGLNE
jgi:hypothetical protein